MKKIFAAILVLIIASEASAETTKWWGLVSFRQRYEDTRTYADFQVQGEPGTIRSTDINSRTRMGYQLGFFLDLADNIRAGFTVRSGLGSVMWQDVDSFTGLAPGVQELYLKWSTPFAYIWMGKIPQNGSAMWDLYACAKQEDYNPTDGIFNDRMSALNGVKVEVPFEYVTLRGIYHTDFTGGSTIDWEKETNMEDKNVLDWNVLLIGLNAVYKGFELDADYGFPKRVGDKYRSGQDSVYVEEDIWGFTLKKSLPEWWNSSLQVGYGFNWRDSVYTADFWDLLAQVEVAGCRCSARYQHNIQEHEFGIYRGHKAKRQTWHLYFNKEIWNLDVQPRVVWFLTKVDGQRNHSLFRAEITGTVRF